MSNYYVEVIIIELSKRQQLIVTIVKGNSPITGEQIAEKLNLTRATLRPDLAILTMSGFLDARPRVGYFYVSKSGNQLFGEHIRKLYVRDYKSIPVVVKEDSSVYDAICMMFLEDVGNLFVVKEERMLSGVISRKDLLKATLGKQNLQEIPVGIVMTRMPNIITCSLDDSLYDAAKKLIYNQIDTLPVVKEIQSETNKKLEVVGRVTKTTITKVFVELGHDKEVL